MFDLIKTDFNVKYKDYEWSDKVNVKPPTNPNYGKYYYEWIKFWDNEKIYNRLLTYRQRLQDGFDSVKSSNYGILELQSVYFPKKLVKEYGSANEVGRLKNIKEYALKGRMFAEFKCGCGNIVSWSLHKVKQNPPTSCGCKDEKEITQLDIVDGKLVTNAKKHKNKYGYVKLYVKDGSEYNNRFFKGAYSEHKLIYEMYHGVTLTSNQNIHHKNGLRDDNHIDNLELFDTSQPAGQRVEDKLNYYFDLVKSHMNNPRYKEYITSQINSIKN